jgi:aspartate dehydrogenase
VRLGQNSRAPLKVGLIGNGAIASLLTSYCESGSAGHRILGGLSAHHHSASVGRHPLKANLDELLELRPDVVVECAGHEAVRAHAVAVLEAGVDLIIASLGSLADPELQAALEQAAARGRSRLEAPGGALPGFDALATARMGGIDHVELVSSKPPLAWKGSYAEHSHRLADITVPTAIFAGSAREAALKFPQNANVAAAAALAGIGFDRTQVTLMADPRAVRNNHQLTARGAFGTLFCEASLEVAAGNPKTSVMAACSLMRALEEL